MYFLKGKKSSYILFNFILLVLIYMFSFSFGENRLGLYTNYAYILGFLLSLFFMFIILKERYIKVYYFLFCLFLNIQILTLIFGLVNGGLLQAVVNSGHQVMFFIIFIGLIKYYKLDIYERTNFIADFIVLVSTISLLFAFYGYIYGNFSYGFLKFEVVMKYAFRLQGWYSSPNYLGPVLSLGGITLLYRVLSTNSLSISKRVKTIYIILFLVHVAGLVLTGSKGSYIAFAGGTLILLFSLLEFNMLLFKKIIFWPILLIISYFTTLYLLELMGFNAILVQEQLIRLDSVANNLEGGDRIGYHLTALNMLGDASIKDLLLGHGLGYFINTVGMAPHSGFIEVIIGRGIIIFSLFILLIYILMHKSLKYIKDKKIGALYLALVTVIVLKNFTNTEFPSNNFPGIILIFITAIFSLKRIGNNGEQD